MCNVISLMHACVRGGGYRWDRAHGEIKAGCLGWRGVVWGWAASAAPRYPHSHVICKIRWMRRRGSSWVPRVRLLWRRFSCLLCASAVPMATWPLSTALLVLKALRPPQPLCHLYFTLWASSRGKAGSCRTPTPQQGLAAARAPSS